MNNHDLRAHWIWCSGDERPKNFYLYCRKAFKLHSPVRRAAVCVTADSRYRLLVNGVFVARGPARCDPRRQCLDEWDVTPAMRTGSNVLAALVHHYGEWTFSYILGRGGFFAELDVECEDGEHFRVETDGTWRVHPAEAWERNLPRMSIQLGFPEVYDARKEINGWAEPGFDDAAWERATVIGPAGVAPWPEFLPREIPAMMEVPRLASSVIDRGTVGSVTLGHYLDLLRVVWSASDAVAYLATFVWSPADADVDIHAGSQDAIRLWVNSVEVISHLVARDPAPDQEIVSVHLHRGWNTVLAKIVQGEGQWHFYFRFRGDRSEALRYSASPAVEPERADQSQPWNIVAPFPGGGLEQGFSTGYGPETDTDLQGSYRGKNGEEIRWKPAGVSLESMLTSVVMGREARFPGDPDAIGNEAGLVVPGTPATLYPGAEHGRYAVLDFGMEVTGYPRIEIDGALGGELIDMGYGEVLESPRGEVLRPSEVSGGIVNPDRAAVHNADRYVCRPGKQTFQTFDKRAFRYLQVDVRNLRQPLLVGPVTLNFSSYPVDYAGAFECSDSLLNRIWEVGRWTAQLNMEDAYSDSPWRERGQWWGDVRVEAFVSYYAFGETRLVRQGLRQIAQSQTPDGLTKGVYPTGWPDGILPTYTLLWVISLRDYMLYSGDLSLVRELFPAVLRAMEWFTPFLGRHELLRDVPHWLFVDWAPVETRGESAAVNALYYGALVAVSEMAAEIEQATASAGSRANRRWRGISAGTPGGQGIRDSYLQAAKRVRKGMSGCLWDDRAVCFRDTWMNGRRSTAVSEQANLWAIVFGVAAKRTARRILSSVLKEGGADVRTATPYFAFYLLQGLAAAWRHTRALEYVREQWGAMLEWGATTWWETWEPKASFCHGWSAGPTSFLLSDILGVRPARPGWEEILITPHLAGLTWARGQIPTPRGTVSVEWEAGRDLTLAITIPAPTTMKLPAPRCRKARVRRADGARLRGVIYLPESDSPQTLHCSEPGSYIIQCAR